MTMLEFLENTKKVHQRHLDNRDALDKKLVAGLISPNDYIYEMAETLRMIDVTKHNMEHLMSKLN